MANRPTVRAHDRFNAVCNLWLAWDIYPVHPAGMCLAFKNESDALATISIEESEDGVAWNPVLFSTPVVAGLPSLDLVPLANAMVLFVTRMRYVRIVATPDPNANVDKVAEGLWMWSFEYPPINAQTAAEEY